MNQQPRRRRPRSKQPRRGTGSEPTSRGLWRRTADLPPTEPIVPAPDPTALLRSLGPPPLHGGVAEHYLAAAVERAASVASALAASAGLLAARDGEDD